MQYISLFFYLLIKCFHMKVNFCFITFSMADDDDESAVSFFLLLRFDYNEVGLRLAAGYCLTPHSINFEGGPNFMYIFHISLCKKFFATIFNISQSVFHLFIYSSFSTFKHTIKLCIYDILYIIFVEIKKILLLFI